MDAPARILRVGLTGGIASGKTTVAGILADFGAFVIDADAVAHAVMVPGGSAHAAVVERFGEKIQDEDGRIDRQRLGAIVFHDAQARLALEAIVHPAVMAEMDRLIAEHVPVSAAPIAVFDAALLVESGLHERFHRLIVAKAGRDTQLRRLLVRDGLSTTEAEARIDSQAPLDEKLALADYVVDTEGTLRRTHEQTAQIYAALLGDFGREFG